MEVEKRDVKYHKAAIIYIVLHSLISLVFLEYFPYVHSDESWLAGLTRAMMKEGSLAATEPFFDLVPRYPHGIKILFHLLQMGAIRCFGYRIFSVRLLSLLAGAAALWFIYLTGWRFLKSRGKGLLLMAVFSVDIQFLYASHFARQEIFLFLIQWICLWNLFDPDGFYCDKKAVILGILTGIAIGFHPNSFLMGMMNGMCLFMAAVTFCRNRDAQEMPGCERGARAGLEQSSGNRKGHGSGWRPLLLYIIITGGFAAVFVGISFMMDHGFVKHYFAYGQREFGIDAPWWERITEFFGFLSRLYRRNSGTYYLPDIRPQFYLFGIGGLVTAAATWIMKAEMPDMAGKGHILFMAAAGIVCGTICIGRYNQTSILFFFPFGYLAVAMALELYEGRLQKGLWVLLMAGIFILTGMQVIPEIRKSSYDDYGRQIGKLIPEGARVLGNLNMEFFMGYDCFRDYRNLPYALEGEGLLEYLDRNEIEYIVYHQELDYLWDHRPYYNVIYGNVMFVRELREYCGNSCEKVGSFQNSRYGIRVTGILGREEYGEVTVYRRASSSSSLR